MTNHNPHRPNEPRLENPRHGGSQTPERVHHIGEMKVPALRGIDLLGQARRVSCDSESIRRRQGGIIDE